MIRTSDVIERVALALCLMFLYTDYVYIERVLRSRDASSNAIRLQASRSSFTSARGASSRSARADPACTSSRFKIKSSEQCLRYYL